MSRVKRRFVFFGPFVVLSLVVSLRAQDPPKVTVKDKVYTKAQAAKGKETFTKTCSKCHAVANPTGKEEGPPLAGDVFLAKWDGHSLHEIATNIRMLMPPDGSITVDENGAAELLAFILEANGFPEGDKPLKADATAKNILVVKK